MTAYLHSLACDNAPWRCTVLYPVRETASVERVGAYNDDAGLSSESHRICSGVPGGAQPTAGAPFSLEVESN